MMMFNVPGQLMIPLYEEEIIEENKLMCANLHRYLNERKKSVPIKDPDEICSFDNPADVLIDLTKLMMIDIVADKMRDDYREGHGENAEEGLKTHRVVYHIWIQSEKISEKIIAFLKKGGLTNMNEFGFCRNYESLKGIGKWRASIILELRERLTREPDSIREKLKGQSSDDEKGNKPEKGDEQNR